MIRLPLSVGLHIRTTLDPFRVSGIPRIHEVVRDVAGELLVRDLLGLELRCGDGLGGDLTRLIGLVAERARIGYVAESTIARFAANERAADDQNDQNDQQNHKCHVMYLASRDLGARSVSSLAKYRAYRARRLNLG